MSGEEAGGKGPRVLPQAPPPAPQQTEVPSWKLLLTLGTAGALAGLLIVFVYQATQPTIQAYKAMKLREAVSEVLKGPARWDTLYVSENGLTATRPAGKNPEMIFLGYGDDGQPVGYAVAASGAGFQDVIELIFGYDASTHTLLGLKVLESRETPGLGDKITKDSAFLAGFEGPKTPIVGVKAARATGAPNEVDMITGATISSRAVMRIINDELARVGPMLDQYSQGTH